MLQFILTIRKIHKIVFIISTYFDYLWLRYLILSISYKMRGLTKIRNSLLMLIFVPVFCWLCRCIFNEHWSNPLTKHTPHAPALPHCAFDGAGVTIRRLERYILSFVDNLLQIITNNYPHHYLPLHYLSQVIRLPSYIKV